MATYEYAYLLFEYLAPYIAPTEEEGPDQPGRWTFELTGLDADSEAALRAVLAATGTGDRSLAALNAVGACGWQLARHDDLGATDGVAARVGMLMVRSSDDVPADPARTEHPR